MSRIGKAPISIPSGVNVTVKDNTVTVRERDSMSQDRIKISDLESFLIKHISFP